MNYPVKISFKKILFFSFIGFNLWILTFFIHGCDSKNDIETLNNLIKNEVEINAFVGRAKVIFKFNNVTVPVKIYKLINGKYKILKTVKNDTLVYDKNLKPEHYYSYKITYKSQTRFFKLFTKNINPDADIKPGNFIIWEGKVNIEKPIKICHGAGVIIEKNTEIIFSHKKSKLMVSGELLANGSENCPITFIATNGSDLRFFINRSAIMSSITFKYCKFIQANTCIEIENSHVNFENCQFFKYSNSAIDAKNSIIKINNCIFNPSTLSQTNGVLSTKFSKLNNREINTVIRNSLFINIRGTAISINGGKALVSVNTFQNCFEGIKIFHTVEAYIENNKFENFTNWAIRIANAHPRVNGNMFTKFAGAPIKYD